MNREQGPVSESKHSQIFYRRERRRMGWEAGYRREKRRMGWEAGYRSELEKEVAKDEGGRR